MAAVEKDPKFPASLFQTTAPDMMRPSRMLIIDHDVCTYTSFDLMCHILAKDAYTNDIEHLGSLRKEYRTLYRMEIPLERRIHFMQTKVPNFDPRALFETDYDRSLESYEALVREMLHRNAVPRTVTDVGSRFGIVFMNRQISGYLLRYKGDPYRNSWDNQVTVYEADSLLDAETAMQIILKHRINAVMVGSVSVAVNLAKKIIERRPKEDTGVVTFIIGRYGYNYFTPGKWPIMKHIDMLEALEVNHNMEIGNFEPFRGLYKFTEEERKAKEKAKKEERNGTESD